MSYSLSLSDTFGANYSTQPTLLESQEYFDVNTFVTNSNFVFDDENSEIKINVVLSNNESNDVISKVQKFLVNIGPSILFNEIKNLSEKISIKIFINDISDEYQISSDYLANSQDNFVVGILFSEDENFIEEYVNNSSLLREKFLLFPRVIKPGESVTIIFSINLLDEFYSEIRNKFVNFSVSLYDLSKIYISLIEQTDSVSLSDFYSFSGINRTYLLLKRNELNTYPSEIDIENFLFYILNSNGFRLDLENNLDKYILYIPFNIVNNIKINKHSSGKLMTKLLIDKISGNYLIQTDIHTGNIDVFSYVEKLVILSILDILRPYYIESIYSSNYQNSNAINLCDVYLDILVRLKNSIETTPMLDTFDSSFNEIGQPLNKYHSALLYNLVFLYATIYTEYSKMLMQLNYLNSSVLASVSALENFLVNTTNKNLYSANINIIKNPLKEDIKNRNVHTLFLLVLVLLAYNKSLVVNDEFSSIFYSVNNIYNLLSNFKEYFHNLGDIISSLDIDVDVDYNPFITSTTTDYNLAIKKLLYIAILEQMPYINSEIFTTIQSQNIKLKDNLLNYLKFLYNSFANISTSIVLVNTTAPNSYNFNDSILNLNVKLINILTFIENINNKNQQNSIIIKYIFNNTLL